MMPCRCRNTSAPSDGTTSCLIERSSLAFVEGKEAATQELIRVTKPGGYVGLNESYWIQEPSAELLSQSIYRGTNHHPRAH